MPAFDPPTRSGPVVVDRDSLASIIETGRDASEGRLGTPGTSSRRLATGTVLAKNVGSEAIGVFEPAVVSGLLHDPDASIDPVTLTPVLEITGGSDAGGATDADDGLDSTRAVVVAQQPIGMGELGEVVISGVTFARVDVASTAHRRASIGSSGKLESSLHGRARILENSASIGSGRTMMIALDPTAPFASEGIVRITSSTAIPDDRWEYGGLTLLQHPGSDSAVTFPQAITLPGAAETSYTTKLLNLAEYDNASAPPWGNQVHETDDACSGVTLDIQAIENLVAFVRVTGRSSAFFGFGNGLSVT